MAPTACASGERSRDGRLGDIPEGAVYKYEIRSNNGDAPFLTVFRARRMKAMTA